MLKFLLLTSCVAFSVHSKLLGAENDKNELLVGVPIERESWFDSQMSGSPFSRAYDHLGDIMVFDGGTWNPYPTCKSCGKFQNYMAACPNPQEYLNLCGECVGGSSEKDDDFGLDSCGICGGLERCGKAGCGEDLDEDIETNKNCTKMVGIRPKVIDMATSDKGLIHLIGDVDTKKLFCSVHSGSTDLGQVEVTESPDGLTFGFQLPSKEGRVDLNCNSSDGYALMNSLLVVDSKKLQPLTSDVKHIDFGEESQIALTIGSMYALADLVCFAKDETGSVVYKAWSNDIQGNTLSSKIVCNRIWPKRPGILKFGVAYSEESISTARTLDVNVAARDLTLLRATISSNKMIIQFDQSIAATSKCEDIFKTISDKIAKCSSAGNEIRVKFNGIPKVKIGEILEVEAASASSGIVEQFSVKLDGEITKALSIMGISGPEAVCSGQEAMFDVKMNGVTWNLALQNAPGDDPTVTPGNRQRKTMMMWQRLRQAQKSMRNVGSDSRVMLNTTMLSPGVDYKVKATLQDNKGSPVTVTKNFKVVTNEAVQPVIRGPNSLTWTNDALYEVDNIVCGEQTSDLRFEWTVEDKNRSLIRQMGPKIRLKGGILETNTKYNLRVRILNNTEVVNEAVMEVDTQPTELGTAVYIDEIVYGTGHQIVLQGNPEVVSTRSTLPKVISSELLIAKNAAKTVPYNLSGQYHWGCRSDTGPCVIPGKDKTLLDTLRGFDDSILVLPAGSLPVGKFTFSLNVSLPSGESTEKDLRILVVSGEPTVLTLESVYTDGRLQAKMSAKDIIGACDVYLESLRTINTESLDMGDLTKLVKVKGTPHKPATETLELTVPPDKLSFGSSYKFRLTTDCGALSQSWMTFTVPVPEKSSECNLNVTPDVGSALTTEFTIEATNCSPMNPIYSYGFSYGGTAYYVVTSLTPSQKIYFRPGEVKPVMKICEPDKICTMHYGNKMNIQDATTIETSAIQSVLKLYSDNLLTGHFEEAIGTTRLLLDAITDPEAHKNVSDDITSILADRIKEVSEEYDADSLVAPEALKLLECATEIIKGVESSDEVIGVILEFRDQIENSAKKRSGDTNLPGTDTSRRKRATSIVKRDVDPTIKTRVEQMLKPFELVSIYKNPNKTKVEMDKMLKKLPSYVINLCNGLKKTASPDRITMSVVDIDVRRVDSSRKLNQTIPECSGNCSGSTVQVILYKPFMDKLNAPNGLCLSMNYFKEDYYSMTRNATSETNIRRWSGIHKAYLYKYKDEKVLEDTNNITGTSTGIIRIPIFNATVPPDTNLTCHQWRNDLGWNESPCTTVQRLKVSNMPAIECKCPFPGVYAIFAVHNLLVKNATVELTEKNDPGTVTTAKPAPSETTTVVPTTQAITQQTTAAPSKTTPAAPQKTTTTKPNPTNPSTTTTTTITTSKALVTNGTGAVPPHDPTTDISTVAPITPTAATIATTVEPQDYKINASFLISGKYNETVGPQKFEFEETVKSQLAKTVSIPDHTKVIAVDNRENTKVILRMRSSDRGDIPLLQKLLNNGSLTLVGLNNTKLTVPKQNLELSLALAYRRSSTFAVISSAIFITVAFLLAMLLSGMFLKWKRQQRALSFVQNMEVSAPKYLRLEETTSMERLSRGFGSSENLRSGELDSGIVLTVDPTRISSKYRPAESGSRNAVA